MLIVKFPLKTQVSPRVRVGPHCRLIRQNPVHHPPSRLLPSQNQDTIVESSRMSGAVTKYLWSYLKTVCLRPAVQRLNSTSVSALSFLYENIAKKIFHLFLPQWKLFTTRQATLSNERAASWDHSDIVWFLFIDEETFRAMFPARMLPVPAASKWPQIYSALFQQALKLSLHP